MSYKTILHFGPPFQKIAASQWSHELLLFFVLSRRLRNSISGSLGWRHSLYYSLVATRTSQAHSCLVSMVHGFGGAAHFMPLPCTHGFPSSLSNASIELRTCSFCAVIKAVETSCLMQYKWDQPKDQVSILKSEYLWSLRWKLNFFLECWIHSLLLVADTKLPYVGNLWA